MTIRLSVRWAAVLAVLYAGAATRAGAVYQESVVIKWDSALLQAIRDTKPGPTLVSRDLAIVHTAIYDAWATYDAVAKGTRLGGSLRHTVVERTEANKEKAISYAAYRTLFDLFPQPAEVAKFNTLMGQLGYDPTDTSMDAFTAAGTGNLCADAVLQYRHHDGSNQLGDLHPGAYSDYTGYVAVNDPDHINDPNRWQPLRVPDGKGGFVVQKCLTPHWRMVQPFAMETGSQLRMAGVPYQYSSRAPSRDALFGTKAYIRQAKELLGISANLTDRQKMIAEYWADGPSTEFPPGHWCLIAQFVARRDQHNLDQDAKMFFAVANAVFDAGISSWDCKVAFDYVRPVTAIHFLYKGKWIRSWAGPYKGTQWVKGENWKPYQAPNVVTPAFPECTSGHSSFSAAGSEVLKRFTGSDTFGGSVTLPAGSSAFEAGRVPAHDLTLSWATFTEAADEAGFSRRYGGIHFELGDLKGREIGRKAGALVWAKAQALFNGD